MHPTTTTRTQDASWLWVACRVDDVVGLWSLGVLGAGCCGCRSRVRWGGAAGGHGLVVLVVSYWRGCLCRR